MSSPAKTQHISPARSTAGSVRWRKDFCAKSFIAVMGETIQAFQAEPVPEDSLGREKNEAYFCRNEQQI